MEPKIVFCPQKTVIGKKIRTTNEGGRSLADQPQLWQRFFIENYLDNVKNLRHPGLVIGAYTEYEKDETKPYTYLVGAEVSSDSAIPAGLDKSIIPASQFAVFTSAPGPVNEVVAAAWEQIWNWSKTSGQRRSFQGDFEVYQMTGDPNRMIVEIYIGIEA